MTDGIVLPSGTSAQTSASLLERVKAQDQAAWEMFVHLYTPLVYRWCRRQLQPADAEDVGQAVFQAVAGKIQGFCYRRPGDSFRKWLRTITSRKMIDFARRALRERPAPGGSEAAASLQQLASYDPDGDPEEVLVPDESEALLVQRRAVATVLAGCTERTRQVFHRLVVDDEDPAAIAADLGLSVGAVYSIRSKVIQRINTEFAGLIETKAEVPSEAT